MNKSQEERSTMHNSVDALLGANKSKTDEVPALAGQIATFQADVDDLADEHLANKNATSGTTQSKWTAEDDLITSLLKVVKPMKTIAKVRKDPALADIVNVSDTSLRHSRENELVVTAKSIYAEAIKLAPEEMAAYGITAAELTALAAKIDAYDKSIGGRESSVEVRKGTRHSIIGKYNQVESDLEDIDNSMERLKEKYPEFYNEYVSARIIKATGGGHKAKNAPTQTKPPEDPSKK